VLLLLWLTTPMHVSSFDPSQVYSGAESPPITVPEALPPSACKFDAYLTHPHVDSWEFQVS
jgi:hypothetical protein